MLHFGVLGPLEVRHDGRSLGLGRPKQRAVLATLLLHANAVVSVDRFADALWPRGAAASSARSLPVYVANLRRLLEPERPARTPPQRILTRAPGYLIRVAPGEYDALDFERLLAEGSCHLAAGRPRAARTALGEALALWRGPALAEFDFAEMEAARLEGRRLDALEARIVADLALGEHAAVVGELERLVHDQPLRERLVELLMFALYRSGRQADALRAYATARDRLAEEVGCRPSPALRRLEADILAQAPALAWIPPAGDEPAPAVVPPAPAAPAVPPEPFVGRAGELAVLESALGGSSAAIVLVAGEPGIGKTRLVHEALARTAGTAGVDRVVAWGRCDERDGAPPFWPWIQVVRSLLAAPDTDAVRAALGPDAAEIARIVPEVTAVTADPPPPPPPDPASARYRFFEAVIGFLARMAGTRRVTVVLDDLHWADAPSLHLTGHMASRLPAGVCLIATYREVDPPPDAALTEVLAALARQPGRRDLPLRGWTREEVAEFVVREAGADSPASLLAAVWDRAGGNPFFVGELTRLLVAENPGGPGEPAVPWAVRQVVNRRMGRLPADTRQLLAVAAVAGTEFDLRVVARAAGIDLDQALDQVDIAVAAGMVRERPDDPTGGRFRFSHALVQEAVDAELTQLRRARLHGLVADALEEVAGEAVPATEVAHHRYAAVAVSGPGPAVAAAARAAAAAQVALAHEVAEEHLRRGLALVGTLPAGPERDRLELDLLVQLGALLGIVKGVATPDAARAWERATELCRAVEDQRRLLLSLWGLLTFAWASGDLRGARGLAEHMLQLDRTSSDAAVTVTARLGLGLVAVCCGDLADGSAHLAAGKDVADRSPAGALTDVTFADLQVQVDSWLSLARHLQGDHDGGDRLVEGALRRARALDAPFSLATALSFATCARVITGDLVDAVRLADEMILVTDALQLVDFTYHGRVVRAWALAHTGAPAAEVRPLLDALPSALTAGIRPWHPFWLVLTAEARQRVGDLDEARRLVVEAEAEVDAMGSSFANPDVLRLRGELLAATEPGRRAEALADLLEATRQAEEHGATTMRDRALASTVRLERAGVDPMVG